MENNAYPNLLLFSCACFSLIIFSYGVAWTKSKMLSYFFALMIGFVFSYLLLERVYNLSLKYKSKLEVTDRLIMYHEIKEFIKFQNTEKANEAIDDLIIMDNSLTIGDPKQSEYLNIKLKRKSERRQ
jgi:hypothetical protein